MKSVGFSRDSKIRTALLDPERTCNNCGKRSRKKLLACSRCFLTILFIKISINTARVLVELQKQLSDLEVFGGLPDVSPESSTSDSLPDTGIVSELFPNGLPGSSSHSLSDVRVMSDVVAMPNRILGSSSTCDSPPSPGTDSILFGNPPLLAAGYNGQLEALKFYVNECHQDVNMLGRDGKNLLENIMEEPNWHGFPEHRAAHAWAKALIEGRN
eukprot:scaffold6797_cov62-Cylindrotheca_fusiformis.AAC.1